jgi:HK97 family phage major capsid protein
VSDENQDTIDLKAAKDATEFEPFLDGLEKVADHSMKTAKRIEERAVETETKITRSVEDLEAKMEKSVADILEAQSKLSAFNKTTHLAQAIAPVVSTNNLKDALPEAVKAMGHTFEAITVPNLIRSAPSAKKLHDPMVALAVNAWFIRATQRQCLRKYGGDLPRITKEMEDIKDALNEHFFGTPEMAALAEKAALAEDADATGGYLVPTIVGSEVMRLVTDNSQIAPLCRPWPMTKKVEQVPNEASAVTINWIDEANTLTGGDPTFGQTTLTAEKLAGRATLSIEMFEDSNVALLPFLLAVFSEKMGGELDYQMILGDGSGPQITGVMNASGINAITSGTAAGRSLTWALLVSTFTGASEGSARQDAYWVCSPAGYTQLLSLADSNGLPIVQMNPQGPPAGTILNRPIIESARLGGSLTLDDTTNTATKIVFGPPRTALFGTRTSMRWDVTDQVNWATFSMDCRLIGRYAGNIGVPAAWSYLGQLAY